MPQKIAIEGTILRSGTMTMSFPAVRMKIGGRIYEPGGTGEASGPLERTYRIDDIEFHLRVESLPGGVLRKTLRVTSQQCHPTPDWVETDRQTVTDTSVSRRGYLATKKDAPLDGGEEEGSGVGGMPGCGYPLIGRNFFTGAEHPAAFATIEERTSTDVTYVIRQHPAWNASNCLELAGTVCCWSTDAEESFRKYVNGIRLAPLAQPCFSFCTFWSDPYRGNMFYESSKENYKCFIKAFHELGLRPDVFTLDAGWHDRHSIFEPVENLGGVAGLYRLKAFIERRGSRLGLWFSHNGPMGMAVDYLREHGYAVGRGSGSAYGGAEDFGVLMDPRLENALTQRLEEYVRHGIVQFKMDWDNECATNRDFSERYPTQAHVREASIDAMIRIVRRMRAINPHLIIRNGWWPSPWWLMHVNHVFLSDSNDSEYTVLPSRTQRDSAATYRDTLYYCSLVRDKSPIPLDAFDNHELPHALRNPFHEEPGTFADIMMLAIMRGTSYFPLTIQPESLEDWQVGILSKCMAFARAYGRRLYASASSMFGGNPNDGAIYGFRFECAKGEAWCLLRNPSAMPQAFQWSDEMRDGVWIYPFFERYSAGTPILFAPHEVKVIRLSRRHLALAFEIPFQARRLPDGQCEFSFPAQVSHGRISPTVGALYRIDELEYERRFQRALPDGVEVMFRLRLPYRMRNATLNISIAHSGDESIRLEARSSRSASDDFSCCQLPVTQYMAGLPGIGEAKNPDCCVRINDVQYSIPAQEGGEAWHSLFLHGVSDWTQVRLSISGYYGISRQGVRRPWHPSWLDEELPPAHPLGFSMARMLELRENNDSDK